MHSLFYILYFKAETHITIHYNNAICIVNRSQTCVHDSFALEWSLIIIYIPRLPDSKAEAAQNITIYAKLCTSIIYTILNIQQECAVV